MYVEGQSVLEDTVYRHISYKSSFTDKFVILNKQYIMILKLGLLNEIQET